MSKCFTSIIESNLLASSQVREDTIVAQVVLPEIFSLDSQIASCAVLCFMVLYFVLVIFVEVGPT